MSGSRPRALRVVAIAGTVLALCCSPPVAGRWLAVDALHPDDLVPMWVFSIGLAAASWWLARAARRRPWLGAVLLSALAVVSCELAARIVAVHLTDWPRKRLAELAERTYPDRLAYQSHPFLHYTGRPGRSLVGSGSFGLLPPFNRLGFHGPELTGEKPADTLRVVCLGASTTASGYPFEMQRWLAARSGDAGLPSPRFQCASLALGFYTSNHSVVNFVLNALDLAPDYVVFHHGWNEATAEANAADFRGDYAHVLRAYEPPAIPDVLLIRASVVYRFLAHRLAPQPEWAFLRAALVRPDRPALGRSDSGPLRTYARNVRTIVDLATLRGITPVLVTQPTSTDPRAPFAAARATIERFAAELRGLAGEFGERVLFVDLAAELTGRNELFVDVGHLAPAGIAIQAERIGAAILAHARRR